MHACVCAHTGRSHTGRHMHASVCTHTTSLSGRRAMLCVLITSARYVSGHAPVHEGGCGVHTVCPEHTPVADAVGPRHSLCDLFTSLCGLCVTFKLVWDCVTSCGAQALPRGGRAWGWPFVFSVGRCGGASTLTSCGAQALPRDGHFCVCRTLCDCL